MFDVAAARLGEARPAREPGCGASAVQGSSSESADVAAGRVAELEGAGRPTADDLGQVGDDDHRVDRRVRAGGLLAAVGPAPALNPALVRTIGMLAEDVVVAPTGSPRAGAGLRRDRERALPAVARAAPIVLWQGARRSPRARPSAGPHTSPAFAESTQLPASSTRGARAGNEAAGRVAGSRGREGGDRAGDPPAPTTVRWLRFVGAPCSSGARTIGLSELHSPPERILQAPWDGVGPRRRTSGSA